MALLRQDLLSKRRSVAEAAQKGLTKTGSPLLAKGGGVFEFWSMRPRFTQEKAVRCRSRSRRISETDPVTSLAVMIFWEPSLPCSAAGLHLKKQKKTRLGRAKEGAKQERGGGETSRGWPLGNYFWRPSGTVFEGVT